MMMIKVQTMEAISTIHTFRDATTL